MAQLIEIWWKDIPAQIIVKKSRREQYKYVLEERFEKAIDRMAMRERSINADAYVSGFRKTIPVPIDGNDLQKIATARGKELENAFTDEKLEKIIQSAKI